MRGLLVFVWEQWRQTYKGLAAMGAALVLYGAAMWKFTELLLFIFSFSESLAICCAYLPALGAVALLFLQENRGRIGFAYPRRMLVLPAHTFVLVAAPLVYRLVVILLFGLATGWICDTFLRDVFFIGPQCLILMTLVAAMHAFVFLTCGYGAGTGTAIFAVAFLIGLPGLNVFYQNFMENLAYPNPWTPLRDVPNVGFGGAHVATGVILYWFVVAYLGARYARSEVAEDRVGGLVRIATRVTYFDRDREEFDSPEAAQQWLEWRRGAYLFPWLSLLIGLVLAVAIRPAANQMENRFMLSFYVLAVAPAVVASLVGYLVTRPAGDYQWFALARPLSTSTIAKSRLRAGVKAVVWTYVLLGALFAIAFKIKFPNDSILASLVEDLYVITSTQGPFGQGLRLLAFLAAAAALSSWSLFWLARSAGVVVWLAVAIVGSWFYSTGTLYQYDPETDTFVSATTPFILAMAAFLGVTGVCAIVAAVWRRYIHAITLAVMLVLWLVLVFIGIRMQYAVDAGGPVVLAVWMLMPFIPLASIPLTLEWQRHR